MFEINSTDQSYYIVGIDPGSFCLGFGVIEVDALSQKILSTQAKTFFSDKLYREDDFILDIQGARNYRIDKQQENLVRLFHYIRPVSVCSESPFYSQRRPSAFGVLMQVISTIERALYEYSPFMVLHVVDPPTVKKAVGAKGNAQKDEVKGRVLGLEDLCYRGAADIGKLDEHSIDAIAVAYSRYKALFATTT